MDEVVIYARCEVREDAVAQVTAAAEDFLAAVHAEEGLIAYELSWDVREPTILRLLEHWEGEDAYLVHTGQPHVHEWASMMKELATAPLVANKSRATAL